MKEAGHLTCLLFFKVVAVAQESKVAADQISRTIAAKPENDFLRKFDLDEIQPRYEQDEEETEHEEKTEHGCLCPAVADSAGFAKFSLAL